MATSTAASPSPPKLGGESLLSPTPSTATQSAVIDNWSQLLTAYQTPNAVPVIVGSTASGKTSLVKRLENTVAKEDEGLFCHTSLTNYSEPFAPLTDLISQLLVKAKAKEELYPQLEQAVSSQLDAAQVQGLAQLIPELNFNSTKTASAEGESGKDESNSEESKESETKQNFVVAYCNLLRVLSATMTTVPVVFCLDQLHHADTSTTAVLQFVLADPKISMRVILAFSPIVRSHPLSKMLQLCEAQASTNFVPVVVSSSSSQEQVEQMLLKYNFAQLPENSGQDIHVKCQGNITAIQLCLDIMNLTRDTLQETKTLPLQGGADVTSLFHIRFLLLSKNCQTVLKVATCMVTVCSNLIDLQLLKSCSQLDSDQDFALGLREAMQSKLLQPSPLDRSKIQFTASYVPNILHTWMLKSSNRECQEYHQRIGAALENLQDESLAFQVLLHFCQAKHVITTEQRSKLLGLLMDAGEYCMSYSDHTLALHYIQQGIDLLSSSGKKKEADPSWNQENYHLSWALHLSKAQALSNLGNFPDMETTILTLLQHAKSPLDKLDCSLIQIQAHVTRNMHTDVVLLGVKALSKMDASVAIPNRRTSTLIQAEVDTTLEKLDQVSEEAVLNWPELEEPLNVGIMSLLNTLITSGLLCSTADVVAIAACRTIQLSCITQKIGADTTPVGFVVLGAILCNQGRIERGVRLAELALAMVDGKCHDCYSYSYSNSYSYSYFFL